MLNLSVLLEFAGRGGSRPLERNGCGFQFDPQGVLEKNMARKRREQQLCGFQEEAGLFYLFLCSR